MDLSRLFLMKSDSDAIEEIKLRKRIVVLEKQCAYLQTLAKRFETAYTELCSDLLMVEGEDTMQMRRVHVARSWKQQNRKEWTEPGIPIGQTVQDAHVEDQFKGSIVTFYQSLDQTWSMIQKVDDKTLMETVEPLSLEQCYLLQARAQLYGYRTEFVTYAQRTSNQ